MKQRYRDGIDADGLRMRKTNWNERRMEVGRSVGLLGSSGLTIYLRDGAEAFGEWMGGIIW